MMNQRECNDLDNYIHYGEDQFQDEDGEEAEAVEKQMVEQKAVDLLQTARSLWGMMMRDMALSEDERKAARRCHDEANEVISYLLGE